MFKEDLIPSVANSTIHVGYRDRQPADTRFDWHFHRHCEMFMAVRGGRDFYTDAGEARLGEGDIIFIGRQVPHSTFTPKGTGGILLQFDYEVPAAAEELFLPEPWGKEMAVFAAGTPLNEELRACFLRIAREHTARDTAGDLYIRGYTLQIIAALWRAGILGAPRQADLSALLPALEYINQRYAAPLTLAQVSGVLNVAPAHFCRLFKKAVGVSFLQYLNRLRIHRAEGLLADPSRSIGQIAEAVGFCSAAYFTETFRKIHSRTPREYRKLLTDREI